MAEHGDWFMKYHQVHDKYETCFNERKQLAEAIAAAICRMECGETDRALVRLLSALDQIPGGASLLDQIREDGE